VTVHLDGGTLVIEVADDLAVTLTGRVEQIHRGTFSADFLRTLEAL
jgi:diaminopimelate epimerase